MAMTNHTYLELSFLTNNGSSLAESADTQVFDAVGGQFSGSDLLMEFDTASDFLLVSVANNIAYDYAFNGSAFTQNSSSALSCSGSTRARMVQISTGKFLLVYDDFLNPAYDLQAQIVSISGGIITPNAGTQLTNNFATTETNLALANADANYSLVYYQAGASAGGYHLLYHPANTVSETSFIAESQTIENVVMRKITADKIFAVYTRNATGILNQTYYRVITISAGSISLGAEVEIISLSGMLIDFDVEKQDTDSEYLMTFMTRGSTSGETGILKLMVQSDYSVKVSDIHELDFYSVVPTNVERAKTGAYLGSGNWIDLVSDSTNALYAGVMNLNSPDLYQIYADYLDDFGIDLAGVEAGEFDQVYFDTVNKKLMTVKAPGVRSFVPSWNPNKKYFINNVCFYKDTYYVCKLDHISNSVFDGTQWNPVGFDVFDRASDAEAYSGAEDSICFVRNRYQPVVAGAPTMLNDGTGYISLSPDQHTVTALSTSSWYAGSISQESVDINSGDFSIDFTISAAEVSAGLAFRNHSGSDYGFLSYAIWIVNGVVNFMERGVLIPGTSPYAPTDTFRIEVVSGFVYYKQNGSIIRGAGATIPLDTTNQKLYAGCAIVTAASSVTFTAFSGVIEVISDRMNTFYRYVTYGVAYTVDGMTVLQTGVGGYSRWVAISGKYFAHNNHAGLQGGTTNEYYHLTAAEYTGSGTGVFARVNSPVFTTPSLGAATATSINKVAITAPATGATLTIQDGFALIVNGNATLSGTNTGDVTLAVNTGLLFAAGQTGLALGTPTAISPTSTDAVSGSSHSHSISGFVPSSAVGAAGGVAGLDGGGKVPFTQLPSTLMTFLGAWDASLNSPALVDGTGNVGDTYRVSVAGTQTFGGVTSYYYIGDFIIYNGTVWQRSPAADGVVSVNGLTGAVVLDAQNVTFASATLSNLSASQIVRSDASKKLVSGSVIESDFAFTDIVTANASATAHGLMPKLSGVSTQYIGGDGTWHALNTGAFADISLYAPLTSPTFVTSIDGSATFAAFASSTALTIGYGGTASSTLNLATNATATGNAKLINIGTGAGTGSTTTITFGSSIGTAVTAIVIAGGGGASLDAPAIFTAFASVFTLNLGHNGAGSPTLNLLTGATSTGNSKIINIGTGGLSGSTTTISMGSIYGTTFDLKGNVGIGATRLLNQLNYGATSGLYEISTDTSTLLTHNIYLVGGVWKRVAAANGASFVSLGPDGSFYFFNQSDSNSTIDSTVTIVNRFKIDGTTNTTNIYTATTNITGIVGIGATRFLNPVSILSSTGVFEDSSGQSQFIHNAYTPDSAVTWKRLTANNGVGSINIDNSGNLIYYNQSDANATADSIISFVERFRVTTSEFLMSVPIKLLTDSIVMEHIDGTTMMTHNAYYSSPNWLRYVARNGASLLSLENDGALVFYNQSDVGNTVGSAITIAQRFKVNHWGNVNINVDNTGSQVGDGLVVTVIGGYGAITVKGATEGNLSAWHTGATANTGLFNFNSENGYLNIRQLSDAGSTQIIPLIIDRYGNVVAGNTATGNHTTQALATTATDGFLYVPSAAGIPSGNPATHVSYSGVVPIVVDSANLRAYFYISGTWRYAQLV